MDEPLTDEEIRALGFEPTVKGWKPLGAGRHPSAEVDAEAHTEDPGLMEAAVRPEARSPAASPQGASRPAPNTYPWQSFFEAEREKEPPSDGAPDSTPLDAEPEKEPPLPRTPRVAREARRRDP